MFPTFQLSTNSEVYFSFVGKRPSDTHLHVNDRLTLTVRYVLIIENFPVRG